MRSSRQQAASALALSWLAALPAAAALPTVALASPSAPGTGASGMLQAGFGMLVVLGLIFLCAWLARRFGVQRFGSSQVVKVISSAMVGQRERVVVVEVGGAWLVLGVTASRVDTLHTLAAQPAPDGQEPSARAPRQAAHLFAGKLLEAVSGKPRGH